MIGNMEVSDQYDDGKPHNNNSRNARIQITEDKLSMKKNMGLVGAVSIIVGSIIGSGIFISPKGVLRTTESVGLSLIVWAGSGIISLFGGLCLAELGTLIPHSGGEYTYLKMALGDIPAFLYAWNYVFVILPSSLSVLALTFSTYATSLIQLCGGPMLPVKVLAGFVLILVAMVNSVSTKLASKIIVLFTAVKLSALAVIIVGGIYNITQGKTDVLATGFEGTTKSPFIIALAFYYALWAYGGWGSLNYITEEVKNSSKTLPRAIVIGVILVMVVYVLTNISYLTVLSVEELLDSPAVAMSWGDKMLGLASILMPLSVMASTLGASISGAFVGGRVVFAAARDGFLPEILSYIHVRNYTPLPSIILTISLAVLMITAGDIYIIIGYLSFTSWVFHGLTFLALLILRFKMKDAKRPYKVPVIIPVVMVIVAVYLVVAPIIHEPKIEYLYAFIFVLGGLLFYFPFVYFNLKFDFIDRLTMYCQLLLEVVPPKNPELLKDQ